MPTYLITWDTRGPCGGFADFDLALLAIPGFAFCGISTEALLNFRCPPSLTSLADGPFRKPGSLLRLCKTEFSRECVDENGLEPRISYKDTARARPFLVSYGKKQPLAQTQPKNLPKGLGPKRPHGLVRLRA